MEIEHSISKFSKVKNILVEHYRITERIVFFSNLDKTYKTSNSIGIWNIKHKQNG